MVRVPDADALLAGDLVEESAPPYFGDDSWPMDWPLSLDIVLGLTTPASVVVPGHGAPVDRDFVETQRNEIGIVAETIRDLAGRGVPVDQALDAGEWPWPSERLGAAVAPGLRAAPPQPEAPARSAAERRRAGRPLRPGCRFAAMSESEQRAD